MKLRRTNSFVSSLSVVDKTSIDGQSCTPLHRSAKLWIPFECRTTKRPLFGKCCHLFSFRFVVLEPVMVSPNYMFEKTDVVLSKAFEQLPILKTSTLQHISVLNPHL